MSSPKVSVEDLQFAFIFHGRFPTTNFGNDKTTKQKLKTLHATDYYSDVVATTFLQSILRSDKEEANEVY